MGINGKIGRAKEVRRIRKEREAEAIKAGVDVSDRVAFRAWDNARSEAFWKQLRSEIKSRGGVTNWLRVSSGRQICLKGAAKLDL